MDIVCLKVALRAMLNLFFEPGSKLPPSLQDSFKGFCNHLPAALRDIHDATEPHTETIGQAHQIASGMESPLTWCEWEGYCQRRLKPLFSQLEIKRRQTAPPDKALRYPARPFGPETLFPCEDAGEDPLVLFRQFFENAQNLKHSDNPWLWLEHLDSLMQGHLSNLPAPIETMETVSWYDFARTSAAVAVALYRFRETGEAPEAKAHSAGHQETFVMVSGNFQGIQKFIFTAHGDIRQYRSKLLRGRSLAVSLLSELAADMLCRELELPCISVIFNAAGQFTVLAPGLEDTDHRCQAVENRINAWLFDISYGETVMGISQVGATPTDLSRSGFKRKWREKGSANDQKKYHPIDLEEYGGTDKSRTYLNGFNSDLAAPLCPVCRKRPSESGMEKDRHVQNLKSVCKLCRDHIFLGTRVVKSDRLIITEPEKAPVASDKKLAAPIFDRYQLIFSDGSEEPIRTADILRAWELGSGVKDPSSEITVKYINGYLPRYTQADRYDPRIPEADKETYKKEMENSDPVQFKHIAHKAQTVEAKDKIVGLSALAVLKADVDDLGLLMSDGLPAEKYDMAHLCTLSRQLNAFFAVFLPYHLGYFERENQKPYSDVYTVFAGGDDLFLIGPWNRIIELSVDLAGQFRRYVCDNPDVHFSAGITLHRPQTSIELLANLAEDSLETSKTSGKNRLTLFDETVIWEQSGQLFGQPIYGQIQKWQDEAHLNNAMLYRLNHLTEMAKQEMALRQRAKQAKKKNRGGVMDSFSVSLSEVQCTKWRALLGYSLERNVKAKDESEKGEPIQGIRKEMFQTITQWLETYGGAMKLPLWKLLYSQR